jgi:plastocyanin
VLDGCVSLDRDDDARVAVNELVTAVGNALRGCGFAGRHTAVVQLDGGATADVDLLADSNGNVNGTLTIHEAEVGGAQGDSGVEISGSYDPATGSFSVTGSVPSPGGPIAINISGTLGGSFTFQIGTFSYNGSFGGRPTATPTRTSTPSGTVHVIKVGNPVLPFDPEVVEINPGETVMWMWIGGPHSVRSANLNGIGQPSCTANGLFDSGVQSSGTFSYTFTMPGRYGFHCGVASHCDQNFESGYIDVRGTPTATPTRTFTRSATIAVPTPTPTPELIGGVSTRMLGFFSGSVVIGTQNLSGRLRVEVNESGALATDLSMPAPYIFPNPIQMNVISPTELLYEFAGPPLVRFTLTLSSAGHLIGRYTYDDPIMPHLPIDYDLTKEP